MKRYTAIPKKYWHNKITGENVSIYGSCPWTCDSDKENWEVITHGFSVRDNKNGTIHGNNYPPYYFETAKEAEDAYNRV